MRPGMADMKKEFIPKEEIEKIKWLYEITF